MVKGETGDSSTSGDGVVVRGATNSVMVELPLLTKGSYQEWALVMQVSLEALELWEVVEAEGKDRTKDRRALAAILHGVPPEMRTGLAVKKSAKQAWDPVKKMRGGDVRVKAVVWTSLGPLPRWVPGPTTRWAPGTTRLALHGT
jgi:hypothetical protein